MPVPTASGRTLPQGPDNATGARFSRRNLLAGVCASGLVAAFVAMRPWSQADGGQATAAGQAQAAAQGQALAHAEMDHWVALAGTEFRAAGFRMKLAGVRPLLSAGERPANVTRERAFLAVFDVLAGGRMPGDLIYSMTSPTHALDVFLTSAATADLPNRMHAVFN